MKNIHEELLTSINNLKHILNNVINEEILISGDVIFMSKELDKLIVDFMQLMKNDLPGLG